MSTKDNISFIKKVIYSIKDFEKYPEMATKSFKSVIKYLVQLILIISLVATVASLYNMSKNINDATVYIEKNLPDFTLNNGKLKLDTESNIEIKPNEIIDLIILDTNEIEQDIVKNYTNKISNERNGLVFLKDKLILNINGNIIEYSYDNFMKTYNINNLSKNDVLNYFTGRNLIMIYLGLFVIMYISIFVSYLFSAIIDILALGTIGYFTAIIMRIRLKYKAMIKIAIYSLTLPIILNILYIIEQSIFGYNIKYFDVMYITISYIYIITAILMIKSDLLKRQQELTKIVEEEQKVKEQLEKEEKEQQEEQKDVDNEEKK